MTMENLDGLQPQARGLLRHGSACPHASCDWESQAGRLDRRAPTSRRDAGRHRAPAQGDGRNRSGGVPGQFHGLSFMAEPASGLALCGMRSQFGPASLSKFDRERLEVFSSPAACRNRNWPRNERRSVGNLCERQRSGVQHEICR